MNLPKFLYIQGTRRCNLKCIHCDFWKTSASITEKQLRYKLEIIREFSEFNPDGIVDFGQAGEPLMAPELIKIIGACGDAGLTCQITTNGTHPVEWLKDYKHLKVSVSLDSPDPKVHDGRRGVPGTWDKATSAVKTLGCGISCIATKTLDRNKLKKWADSLGASFIRYSEVQPTFGRLQSWGNPDTDTFYQEHKTDIKMSCTAFSRSIVLSADNHLSFCFDPSKAVMAYIPGCLRKFWEDTDRKKFIECKCICSVGCA